MSASQDGARAHHARPLDVFDLATLGRLPHGFLHYVHSDRMQPPFFHRERVAELKATWDTTARDLLICTAQKVGTHLTKRYVVELLAEAGAFGREHPCFTRDIGHGAVAWPEVTYSQGGRAAWEAHLARLGEGPRLWYTHCDIDDLPMRSVNPDTRFIVCYREPKSVVVSQYHFYRRHALLGVDPAMTLSDFGELFLAGRTYFGDYHAHVRRWVEHAPGAPIHSSALLTLRYEDLVERKIASARKIAAFLLPGHAFADEAIARVAERTGFDVMKDEMTRNPQTFHFRPEVFFRAGTTDDWQNHMSPELARQIDEKTARTWAGTALSRSFPA